MREREIEGEVEGESGRGSRVGLCERQRQRRVWGKERGGKREGTEVGGWWDGGNEGRRMGDRGGGGGEEES